MRLGVVAGNVGPDCIRNVREVPVAAVEVRAGAVRPDPAELVALCRDQLTPYEVPVEVLVLDELPRTPSQKVSRPDLLALFETRSRAVVGGAA